MKSTNGIEQELLPIVPEVRQKVIVRGKKEH